MTKNNMLLAILSIGCMGTTAFGMDSIDEVKQFRKIGLQFWGLQSKIVNDLRSVEIRDNDLFTYFLFDYQSNSIENFGLTTIVECKKNGEYAIKFQLDELRKAYWRDLEICATDQDKLILRKYNKFQRFANARDAIECPDLIELPNREGEMKPVTVAIYGTQNLKHCDLYKKHWEQSKKNNQ